MPDGIVFLLFVFGVLLVIAAAVGIFASMSNNRNDVQTLEEANRRLMEMRVEYKSYRKKNE